MKHIKKFESNDFPEREESEKFFGDIEKKHKIDPSKRKQSQNRRYFITSVDENGKKYLDINIPNIELTSSGRDHLGDQIDQVGAILINKGNHSNSYLVPISDGLYNEIEEFAKKYNEWYSKNKEIDNLIDSYSDILSGLSTVSKYDPDFDLMDDVATFEDKIESRLKELYKKDDECPDYIVVMKKIGKEVPAIFYRHILKP